MRLSNTAARVEPFLYLQWRARLLEIAAQYSPLRVMKEVRDLPVEKYDLVINDFECITSTGLRRKKVLRLILATRQAFYPTKHPGPIKRIKQANGS